MADTNLNDVAHPLAKYRNHLEFNGYNVEEDEEVLLCRHPRKTNLMLKPIADRGVLISTLYFFEENAERIDQLEYVNGLNAEFVFLKAYIDDEENALVMETFFEGDYDRTNFSILLENIEYDMSIFGSNELTPQLLQ